MRTRGLLCLVAILAALVVEGGGVPPPKPKPQGKSSGPSGKSGGGAKQTSTSGTILIRCDADCALTLDGAPAGRAPRGVVRRLPAAAGEHFVGAGSGVATWEQLILVKAGEQVLLEARLAKTLEAEALRGRSQQMEDRFAELREQVVRARAEKALGALAGDWELAEGEQRMRIRFVTGAPVIRGKRMYYAAGSGYSSGSEGPRPHRVVASWSENGSVTLEITPLDCADPCSDGQSLEIGTMGADSFEAAIGGRGAVYRRLVPDVNEDEGR